MKNSCKKTLKQFLHHLKWQRCQSKKPSRRHPCIHTPTHHIIYKVTMKWKGKMKQYMVGEIALSVSKANVWQMLAIGGWNDWRAANNGRIEWTPCWQSVRNRSGEAGDTAWLVAYLHIQVSIGELHQSDRRAASEVKSQSSFLTNLSWRAANFSWGDTTKDVSEPLQCICGRHCWVFPDTISKPRSSNQIHAITAILHQEQRDATDVRRTEAWRQHVSPAYFFLRGNQKRNVHIQVNRCRGGAIWIISITFHL